MYEQSDQEAGQELKSKGTVYFFDQATYEQLTGQKVELGENEILAYGYQYPGRLDAQLEINGKTFTIKQKLDSNLSKGNSLNPTCFNTKWACT